MWQPCSRAYGSMEENCQGRGNSNEFCVYSYSQHWVFVYCLSIMFRHLHAYLLCCSNEFLNTPILQIKGIEKTEIYRALGHSYGEDTGDPLPVLLLGNSHGRRSLVGCSRITESDMTSLSLFTFMPWRRKWQPTPVFLPGESQGRGSLVGCSL